MSSSKLKPTLLSSSRTHSDSGMVSLSKSSSPFPPPASLSSSGATSIILTGGVAKKRSREYSFHGIQSCAPLSVNPVLNLRLRLQWMQPSLILSASLFFLPVREALKLQSPRIHPHRLCRFAVFLIQTIVLSLKPGWKKGEA